MYNQIQPRHEIIALQTWKVAFLCFNVFFEQLSINLHEKVAQIFSYQFLGMPAQDDKLFK